VTNVTAPSQDQCFAITAPSYDGGGAGSTSNNLGPLRRPFFFSASSRSATTCVIFSPTSFLTFNVLLEAQSTMKSGIDWSGTEG
jgi:hypothetical protein